MTTSVDEICESTVSVINAVYISDVYFRAEFEYNLFFVVHDSDANSLSLIYCRKFLYRSALIKSHADYVTTHTNS